MSGALSRLCVWVHLCEIWRILTVLYPSITSLVAGNTTGGGNISLMCPQCVRTCKIKFVGWLQLIISDYCSENQILWGTHTEGSVSSQVVQFSIFRMHLTLCSLSSYLELKYFYCKLKENFSFILCKPFESKIHT